MSQKTWTRDELIEIGVDVSIPQGVSHKKRWEILEARLKEVGLYPLLQYQPTASLEELAKITLKSQ